MLNRRNLLKSSALAALAPTIPALFSDAVQAQDNERDSGDRILVVIQLTGGNDGINTVVPFADENYAKSRPTLRLRGNELIKLNDHLGFNAGMRAAADLLEDGRLAVVQGVGYPNPNRSHDVSMAIWQTARLTKNEHGSLGWIGRATDTMDHVPKGTPHSILLGTESPPTTLLGRRSVSGAFAHPSELRLSPHAQLPSIPTAATKDSLLAFAQRSVIEARTTAGLVQQATREDAMVRSLYPPTKLAERLKAIGQLIKSGFQTPVYYAIQPGYDTHIAQRYRHLQLLEEWTGAMKGFLDDMKSSGLADRVSVLCFSEFGRRVEENASEGTDHGTAGPVFLAGVPIKPGLIGKTPKLDSEILVDGDLRSSIDFRQVYASVLKDWFNIPSSKILAHADERTLPLFG